VLIDLDPVDRITADAVGPPGERVFYLQGRKADRVVSLLVEKQQVQLLAASVVEILSRLGKKTGEGPGEDAMGLEEPIVPEWRAGRLSIGYEEDRDLILLEAEELLPEEETEDDEDEGEVLENLGVELEATELPGPEGEPNGGPEAEEWTDELEGLQDLEELEEIEELEELAELQELEEPPREPGRVRFWATREQMLSLARHGASVCAQGRPLCQLCHNPIEPEGHQCPALNGHRKTGE
jgi:uncharacterized repeat protein (TIGR03847 family)